MIEHLEAKNHQTALNFVFNSVFKRRTINDNFVLKIHSILMNGIIPNAGQYRRHGVRIVVVNLATTNYLKISNLLQDLLSGINSKNNVDMISLSTRVHSKFEQIHPFSDGNGRVSRLLMLAMLLSANYAPAIIKQQKKRLYYTYLYKAQTKGDYSQLEYYICDAIIDGFKILDRE